ncbi:P-loop containing nucleoside triphosphate hydrolase protein [Pluteus cervinus]|uniref:P-loop containing nucleoside triphosphate hydrolase protein n=1 Tax=Pluteus cervinus TaxID=181527 RepID=A0ACD3BAQ7_9AGAR|nr:P-loop containing nucleoside triphosphate hydrolase protein [Pluteus cervinus]
MRLPALFDPQQEEKFALILCGLIASGKSTFAHALQRHFPRFQRCNQDDLGDRRQVEHLARKNLSEGNSVCIDRTNFNEQQRAHWVNIASEFPGTRVWVIVFDTPYEICAARLQTRTGHPTIKTAEEGLSVLARFAADFRPPAAHEGHDRILYLKPEDHTSPEWTAVDIAAVLQKVRDSPPIVNPGRPVNPRGRGQARGRRTPFSNSQRGGIRGGQYSSNFRGWGVAHSTPSQSPSQNVGEGVAQIPKNAGEEVSANASGSVSNETQTE